MVKVQLHNLLLQANHGISAEERKLENTFEINFEVSYEERKTNFDNLEETINYETLFEIIKERMDQPSFLLEKICQDILNKVKSRFPMITEINVSIYKLQVPIEGFEGKAGVTLSRKF
jgi:7,8-dihydroneopterin aldolase/epimerase/oxygenase